LEEGPEGKTDNPIQMNNVWDGLGGSMNTMKPQKRVIAVCGKGGSGKTALTALMIKYIIQRDQKKLLVIDADPTMNLPMVLGIKPERTINDIREKIIKEARTYNDDDKENLARSLEYLLFEALMENDDFSFVIMGRPETLGCYCPINDVLRSGIETLAEHFDTIIIDGEAGVEQINRQVMRGVDIPIIVSDISSRGLQTAALIKKVIESHNQIINFIKMGLVLNRVWETADQLEKYVESTGLDLFGFVPEDKNISLFDMQARPLLEIPDHSPAFMAVEKILHQINAD